jgi:hypothetical protein
MKTKKWINFTLVAAVCVGLLFDSCKKKEDDTAHYQAATDNSIADGVYNRSFNQIKGASYQATTLKDATDTIIGCPTLYITGGTGYPKTVTLDFGTNCVCDDGVTRSGQIVSVITGPYIDSGTVVTSTFQNYHEIFNGVDYQATGTQVVTNVGDNQAGHPVYSVSVQGSVISVHGTISYTSQRENEWIVGYNSWLNPYDDEYLVTGTADGTDINGEAFAITITQALDFNIMCDASTFWTVKSGKFELSYPGTSYPTMYVDYGTGTCDYIIYVTIDGVTYTVIYN